MDAETYEIMKQFVVCGGCGVIGGIIISGIIGLVAQVVHLIRKLRNRKKEQ